MGLTKKSLVSLFPQDFLLWISRETKKNDSRCTFPIDEVSPLLEGVIEDFVNINDNILLNYDSEEKIFHFGSNIYGSTVCVSLDKKNYGCIFYYDNEERCFWSDDQFSFIKPRTDGISKYLKMRREGLLNDNYLGLSSYYFVASNFNDFQSKCISYSLDDQDESTVLQESLYSALEKFDKAFLKREIIDNSNWKEKFDYKSRASLTQLCAALGYIDTFVFLVENGFSTEKCLKAARNNNQKNIEEYIVLNGLSE